MTRFIYAALAVPLLFLSGSQMSATAQVTAAAPDLVPIPSRMLNGTISVRNTGSADAGAFVATAQCQKQGGGGCAEHRGMAAYTDPAFPNRLVVQVPALKRGQVFNHALPFWNDLDWQPGNYNFLIEADAGKTVGETDEGNNIGGAVLSK